MITIGVVILNWNGIELLKQFLPDVLKYSPEATVYIADNASTDASVDFVRENYPQAMVIQNRVNGGYSKGYNDALSTLSEDVFILLNSDVQVTPYWLEPILSLFKNEPEVAAVQPKILDYKKPDHFEYAGAAGGFIDQFGYPYCRGRIFNSIEKDEGQYEDEIAIFWASGACLAIRKEIFYEVGGLDEDYFAHQEEIDLCWRLHNYGYRIKYTPKAVVYHIGGATLSSQNPKKTFYNFRNSLFNLVKNVPSNKIFWVISVRLILDGLAAFKFLFELKPRHFTAIFTAHLSFYHLLPKMLKKRQKLPKNPGYFTRISVAWRHFLKGITIYSDL